MAAPFYAISETMTLVAATEQHFTANHVYDTIVVDNSGDPAGAGVIGGVEVYVAFDGGTAAVKGASCESVPYGQVRVFSNALPAPNPHTTSGAAVYNNGYTSSGVNRARLSAGSRSRATTSPTAPTPASSPPPRRSVR
jgi:hypothetical protein